MKGEGKPVVFLHGFLESLEMWDVLEPDHFPFQSILIDLPGHGEVRYLPEDDSIRAMAAAVFELLEELELTDYSVVGHSMGGYVALQMAQINSDIEKVVLLNSNFWQDSETRKKDRNRILQIVEKNKNRYLKEAIPSLYVKPEEHKEFIEMTCEIASNMTMEAIQYATKAIRDREDNEVIADLLGPGLLFIQGELDLSVPLKDMLHKTAQKKYRIAILEGVGHMSHVEATTDVKMLLADFLQ